ncbi:unnamed protein product [Vicia faba]|uniref:Ribosome-recycling factor, chloroplastic n=1 Tax=Vicia faba TaxID=3906 RepID=A0AAV0ZX23_VICFA|nr:unnamed protein product [Vicia faba]
MATSFSPTTPLRYILQNRPKPLLSAESSYSVKRSSTYATLNLPRNFTLPRNGKPLLSKGFLTLHRRKGIVRAATIEEIEAEKASIEKDVKNRMEKTLDNVRLNFSSIRTGRANPAMLDKIEVEYYGSPVSLKSIAQISTPDASSLLVQPYDKSSLKSIEKAIVNSDVGMTPNNDGEVLRLSIPQLTSDRRKELTKIVAKQVEEGKVALRNIRRDALKAYEKLEKEKKLSEDNVKDLSSDLQKLTDDYIKRVDVIYKQKEKELLTV